MQINQANINELTRGFRTNFVQAYQAATEDLVYPKLCMTVPSMSAKEVYGWLGAIPGMDELIGEAAIKNLHAHEYAIYNKEWHDTIGVKQTDVERDTYGYYSQLFATMGDVARMHPDELLATRLAAGFSTLCYTGKNFFDTDHEPVKNGQKFTNLGTKKLSQANFRTARKALKNVRNSAGRSMKNGRQLTLVVSPSYEDTARDILFSERLANGQSNTDKDSALLQVFPELTTENEHAWFLLEMGRPVKPFIWQLEKTPNVVTNATNLSDTQLILTHEFIYQGYGRYNVGYGLPELAWGSTGADAA